MTTMESYRDSDVAGLRADLKWYLLQCKPGDCFRAQDNLDLQGVCNFLPLHSVQRKRARQAYWNREPLFPYYLFIRVPEQCNWASIRSTRGVAKVVNFNGTPISVDKEIVYGLQRKCAELAGKEPEPLFEAGQKVVITDGCFKELEAIVQCTRSFERVVLLLDMLNRSQRIELPTDSISRC